MKKQIIKLCITIITLGVFLTACKGTDSKMNDDSTKDMQQEMSSTEMMNEDDGMKSDSMMNEDGSMEAEGMMNEDDSMESDGMMNEDDNMEPDSMMNEDSNMKYEEAVLYSKSNDNADNKSNNYDFNLEDLNGNYYKLSEHTGKKVYVKFWASWCSICLAGLEELDTLAGEDNDFEVVTIVAPNNAGEKDKESFKEWFKSLEYKNINVLFDEDGDVLKHYGIRAYPSSVYIDSTGKEEKIRIGHVSSDEIKETFMNIN